MNQLSSIVAEDIGKFPDNNVIGSCYNEYLVTGN